MTTKCERNSVVMKVKEELSERIKDSIGLMEVKTVEATDKLGEGQESCVGKEPVPKDIDIKLLPGNQRLSLYMVPSMRTISIKTAWPTPGRLAPL